MQCRLCRASDAEVKYQIGLRTYYECPHCSYLFVDASQYIASHEEKTRYLQHNNTRENTGYCEFLKPAVRAVQHYQDAPARGLDYGCGPGPVLAQLLSESGYEMELYDPYFHPRNLDEVARFDFLTCTEAAEHFHDPIREIERMKRIMLPGGPLVWMTELWTGGDFELWYYKNDPTHVGFFSPKTVEWIADYLERDAEILGRNLFVFRGR